MRADGKRRGGQRYWVPALILALTRCAPAPTENVAASAGQTLAEQWCAECHDIRRDGARSPNRRAPPFQKLAASASFTDYTLRATLRTQHVTMPQIMFTPAQLDDIVAYILSLKQPG